MSKFTFAMSVLVALFVQSYLTAQTDSTVQPTTSPVTGITIPEGTKLMVNMNTPISTAKNPKGSTFTSILEADLVLDGKKIGSITADTFRISQMKGDVSSIYMGRFFNDALSFGQKYVGRDWILVILADLNRSSAR